MPILQVGEKLLGLGVSQEREERNSWKSRERGEAEQGRSGGTEFNPSGELRTDALKGLKVSQNRVKQYAVFSRRVRQHTENTRTLW